MNVQAKERDATRQSVLNYRDGTQALSLRLGLWALTRQAPLLAVADVELLLGRLSVDADVVIEVTSGMPVVSALADRLLASGVATELHHYETLTGPPADSH